MVTGYMFPRFFALSIALLLASCTPSLEPLYTAQDLVFDAGLAGTWTEKGGEATWVVKPSGENSYEVSSTAEGEAHRYEARLLQLGSERFLDLTPKEKLGFKDDFFGGHWVCTHTFYRIRREGDSVRVGGLDPDSLKPLVEAKRLPIAQLINGEVLLTGPTAALQEFVVKHREAFVDPVEYRRVK